MVIHGWKIHESPVVKCMFPSKRIFFVWLSIVRFEWQKVTNKSYQIHVHIPMVESDEFCDSFFTRNTCWSIKTASFAYLFGEWFSNNVSFYFRCPILVAVLEQLKQPADVQTMSTLANNPAAMTGPHKGNCPSFSDCHGHARVCLLPSNFAAESCPCMSTYVLSCLHVQKQDATWYT